MKQETQKDIFRRTFRETFWRDQPTITVSEWSEQKRVMPSDTPFPGPWRNKFTPHIVEIMDCLSAFSGITDVTFVKGTQQAATAAAENALGYWMDAFPTKALFISATDGLLQTWVVTRFEKMLDSCGLREKIFAQSYSRGNKRTGDRTFLKEFIGGFVKFVSAQSPANLRSVDARIVFQDEVDGYPLEMSTGEGSPLALAEARTDAWSDRKKIFRFSTPTTYERSLIWKKYELGDQRRRFVPCPRCGEFQILEFGHGFGHENPNLGLQWQIVDGQVKKAWYVCNHCGAELRNHDKRQFLHLGEWRPTATSFSPKARSYQLSSLYSPPEMFSFEDLVNSYLEAREKGGTHMASFVNTRLGLPFRETGTRPKLESIIELRGDYHAGTVPSGVIFLTGAVDVQRGSESFAAKKVPVERLTLGQLHEKYGTDPKGRPPRIEFDVCGHGPGYRTWDIEHVIITGAIDDPNQGAWEELGRYWRETEMIYRRASGGELQLAMVLVDSGDGPHTPCVYAFARAWSGVLPSKGMRSLKWNEGDVTNQDINRAIVPYRARRLDAGDVLIEINGPHYKTHIYTAFKIPRKYDGSRQQANFCEFPVEYGQAYFEQLQSEEMSIDERTGNVVFTKSSARSNEALDLRVMNLVARDYYLEQTVLWLQSESIRLGSDAATAKREINSKAALDWLAEASGIPND